MIGQVDRAINYLVRLLTAHDASWDAYLLGLGYEPLGRVAPRLSVEADGVSGEWVRCVHEHLAALEAPEPA
jgi:hypothetical protein